MQQFNVEMDSLVQKRINDWLEGPYDEVSKEEIRRLQKEDPASLIDAFYTQLEFGTGGLRGIMGPGTNRINIYTVASCSQGIANYLKKLIPNRDPKVLIGFDTRQHSKEFAEVAAGCFSANGIQVYLYDEFRPVALLSFGLLHLQCDVGVMITASHNPPKYNGYKVWWSNGAQVLPPHDVGMMEEIRRIEPKMVKKKELPNEKVKVVGKEIDEAYLKAIAPLQIDPTTTLEMGSKLKIIYTSLHGGGVHIIPEALAKWGFSNVSLVDKQCIPDGTFPTVKSPNPEERATLDLGIKALQTQSGDILLATDPDVDRLGLVTLQNGEIVIFNGNEIACLGLEFLLSSLKKKNKIPPKPIVVKTIVTSELYKAIARHYGIACLDVLTGFKYIGEKIAEWEDEKESGVTSHHFLFGAEESYGFLLGTHARDKDAVVASLLIAEAALSQKLQGKTLLDLLYDIYKREGIYREKLLSLTFEGKEGMEKIGSMMETLRNHPPKKLFNADVITLEDYQTRKVLHLNTGIGEPLFLPKSNVLRFFLSDGTKLVVRPSGTEPKIKIYCSVIEKHHPHTIAEMEKAIAKADLRASEYLREIEKLF